MTEKKTILGLRCDVIKAASGRFMLPYLLSVLISGGLFMLNLMSKDVLVGSWASLSLVIGSMFTAYYREEKKKEDDEWQSRNYDEIKLVKGVVEMLRLHLIPSATPKNDPSIKPIGVTGDDVK